jgi:hypothetical protein
MRQIALSYRRHLPARITAVGRGAGVAASG